MKIAIVTDMEGVAGVVNFEDWTFGQSRYYERGKEYLTHEVNAAIDGFFAAGATEIVVLDAHGSGAIDTMLLDERVFLSRGWYIPHHHFGLDEGYDALAFVGQHAKSGSLYAHLCHTGDTIVLEYEMNGISVGEFGELAAIAGFFGTPTIFGSGDQAFTEEAKALMPHVHTVSVKVGVNKESGDELDKDSYERHATGAKHIHPKRSRALIREASEKALRDFIANRDKYPPFKLEPPFVLEQWLRPHGDQKAYKTTRRHDTDIVAMYKMPMEIEYM